MKESYETFYFNKKVYWILYHQTWNSTTNIAIVNKQETFTCEFSWWALGPDYWVHSAVFCQFLYSLIHNIQKSTYCPWIARYFSRGIIRMNQIHMREVIINQSVWKYFLPYCIKKNGMSIWLWFKFKGIAQLASHRPARPWSLFKGSPFATLIASMLLPP